MESSIGHKKLGLVGVWSVLDSLTEKGAPPVIKQRTTN